MVQIKSDRLSDRYCPKCGMPMQYWGSKKNKMLLCIVKECNNCIPYEQAWKGHLVYFEDLEDIKGMEG